MSEQQPKTIRETDETARVLARKLIAGAGFAALGVLEPRTGVPLVSRIAVAATAQGGLVFLASRLSAHTRALAVDARCSLLVGEPGSGDPLVHPRMTLIGKAAPYPRQSAEHFALRELWLARHPKAKLYVDFADFQFFNVEAERAHLNGGFGKAYMLTPQDWLNA